MVHLTNWLCLLSLISTTGEPAGATIILESSPLCPSRQTFVKARLIRTFGPCWGLSPFISESRCASDSRLQRHHERPSQYSSVIRTLSVLKSQDVTCRDEDLSRPRTTETSCLWILGPGNAMSGSCLGSPSWPGVRHGQSLAREDRRPHHVHIVFMFRRARHCHLLATRHTVMFSCSCLGQRPEDFPTEFFFHRGKVFRTFPRANSANPWSGFNGDPFESPTLRSRPTTTAVKA